ncbi:hypothetical protein [Rhizobium laguerreae]|nr:hypothetical protein [Rhizobium laguerreae]MBY3196110.1 hypothetical protein [Rhizobium laguerreae]MBY3228742.1 hypothetical protein [Rhizobium laguerreae]MBY3560733.1 hypothetical protein [Rhizobium laguerreae]
MAQANRQKKARFGHFRFSPGKAFLKPIAKSAADELIFTVNEKPSH